MQSGNPRMVVVCNSSFLDYIPEFWVCSKWFLNFLLLLFKIKSSMPSVFSFKSLGQKLSFLTNSHNVTT